jgi:hypothetical protein
MTVTALLHLLLASLSAGALATPIANPILWATLVFNSGAFLATVRWRQEQVR